MKNQSERNLLKASCLLPQFLSVPLCNRQKLYPSPKLTATSLALIFLISLKTASPFSSFHFPLLFTFSVSSLSLLFSLLSLSFRFQLPPHTTQSTLIPSRFSNQQNPQKNKPNPSSPHNRFSLAAKMSVSDSSTTESKRRSVRTLVGKLSSVSEKTRLDSLSQLHLMSKLDPEIRPLIVDSGAIPYLAETLYSSTPDSQENASATLLNLSISCKDSLISTRGVLDAISHVLSNHRSTSSPTAVQSSAATLHSLLVVDNYRPIIGSKRDIVYALVDIIKSVNSPSRSIKDALKALFGISLYPLNRSTMVNLGAVAALFSLIVKDGRIGIVEDSTAVIAQVAGCEESEEAFRKVGGIGVLVDLIMDSAMGSMSMRTKENVVSALLNMVMCCGGEKVVVKEVRERSERVVDGVADVAENGSPKGKNKAVALLNVLLDDGLRDQSS